jgi:hypothetical protein
VKPEVVEIEAADTREAVSVETPIAEIGPEVGETMEAVSAPAYTEETGVAPVKPNSD